MLKTYGQKTAKQDDDYNPNFEPILMIQGRIVRRAEF